MRNIRLLLVACVVVVGLWVFANVAQSMNEEGGLNAPTVDGFAKSSQTTRQW